MSTAQTWQTESTAASDTLALAGRIGAKLHGGECIVLDSDLGGGKTTFVRGLAKGMGSSDTVHSPSFTISNQYEAGSLVLCHFDFYRLHEPGIMRDELAELINDPQIVIAVEWAESIADVLPASHISICISATGEQSRSLQFSYPETFAYIFDGLVN